MQYLPLPGMVHAVLLLQEHMGLALLKSFLCWGGLGKKGGIFLTFELGESSEC